MTGNNAVKMIQNEATKHREGNMISSSPVYTIMFNNDLQYKIQIEIPLVWYERIHNQLKYQHVSRQYDSTSLSFSGSMIRYFCDCPWANY